jgi:excisionase family DNA binding protein
MPRPIGPQIAPPPALKFFTVAEVAAILRCSSKTILRRIEVGKLKAKPDGGRYLIAKENLDGYLQ